MNKLLIGLLVLAALLTAGDWELEPRASVSYRTLSKVTLSDRSHPAEFGPLTVSTGADYDLPYGMALFFDTDVAISPSHRAGFFSPRFALFTAGLKYQMTEKLSISVEHSCGHPILNSFQLPVSVGVASAVDVVKISWGR